MSGDIGHFCCLEKIFLFPVFFRKPNLRLKNDPQETKQKCFLCILNKKSTYNQHLLIGCHSHFFIWSSQFTTTYHLPLPLLCFAVGTFPWLYTISLSPLLPSFASFNYSFNFFEQTCSYSLNAYSNFCRLE